MISGKVMQEHLEMIEMLRKMLRHLQEVVRRQDKQIAELEEKLSRLVLDRE